MIGTVLLFLLMGFPAAASAAEEGFTLSLRPSAEVVNPGDTVQLAVQVHNDGWPDAGEAEVAAFQATLDYDRSLLEFQSVEIPEGTMGDFRPDSGVVLGYGEGHVFQESFDCAVLTMKVAENAEGEIPVTVRDVILGKQDATELTVSSGGTLTLTVGTPVSGESSSAPKEERASAGADQSAGAVPGRAGTGSTASDSSGSGSGHTANAEGNLASSGKNTSKKEAVHRSGSSQEKTGEDGGTGGSLPENPAEASSAGTTGADSSSAGDGAEAGASGDSSASGNTSASGVASDRGQDVSRAGHRLLWGLLPVVIAAAIAAGFFYRKYYSKRRNS